MSLVLAFLYIPVRNSFMNFNCLDYNLTKRYSKYTLPLSFPASLQEWGWWRGWRASWERHVTAFLQTVCVKKSS